MSNLIRSQCIAPLLLAASTTISASAEGWQDRAIAPVANPVFFETPMIQSEVRPLFMFHRLDSGLLGQEVDVKLYAVQLRYALTERLALIATKDGYIEVSPASGGGTDGWTDLAAGLKYALIQSEEQQFVLTPGFTFEIPTGNRKVFQGNGRGELNVFVSAMKGWNNLHATVSVGGRIPMDFDRETANIRYSAMLDYWVSSWFIPFVTVNAFTTVTEAEVLGLESEGFDLINFGSTSASGHTQAAFGVGFRSRLLTNLDLGFAYERGWISKNDLFKDRFTVDLIWRF